MYGRAAAAGVLEAAIHMAIANEGVLELLVLLAASWDEGVQQEAAIALANIARRPENRIAVARRDYIQAVQQYNTEIRTFPGRIWHSVLYSELEPRENFEATTENAEQAPSVNFD